MLNIHTITTKEVGTTEFVDSKSRRHIIKHSVILTEEGQSNLEEKIADDLFRIQQRRWHHTAS